MVEFLELAYESIPALLRGLVVSLKIWIQGVFYGFVLAIFLSIGRVYGKKAIYLLCTIYIEIFRGTPFLVQLFVIYFGLPDIGIMLEPVVCAIIAVSLNIAAYGAEYLRGTIQSVSTGQMVAARSLGMSKIKAIRYIILPQAIRLVIPQWSNLVVIGLHITSICITIGVVEILAEARYIGFRTFRYFEIFLIAGFFYAIIILSVCRLLNVLDEKVRIPWSQKNNT